MCLTYSNSVHAVRELISQPGFQPSDILAEVKEYNMGNSFAFIDQVFELFVLSVKGMYPKLNPLNVAIFAPSFELTGQIMQL